MVPKPSSIEECSRRRRLFCPHFFFGSVLPNFIGLDSLKLPQLLTKDKYYKRDLANQCDDHQPDSQANVSVFDSVDISYFVNLSDVCIIDCFFIACQIFDISFIRPGIRKFVDATEKRRLRRGL